MDTNEKQRKKNSFIVTHRVGQGREKKNKKKAYKTLSIISEAPTKWLLFSINPYNYKFGLTHHFDEETTVFVSDSSSSTKSTKNLTPKCTCSSVNHPNWILTWQQWRFIVNRNIYSIHIFLIVFFISCQNDEENRISSVWKKKHHSKRQPFSKQTHKATFHSVDWIWWNSASKTCNLINWK